MAVAAEPQASASQAPGLWLYIMVPGVYMVLGINPGPHAWVANVPPTEL